MADFNTAYRIVHGHEGGYANNGGDKGGETYMGIARRYHPEWAGWVIIDAWKTLHGQPRRNYYFDSNELVEDVVSFYKGSWNELQGSRIASQPVANLLYDFATNSGRAVQVAQGVLNQLGYALQVDNQVGPLTLAAINAADPATFHNALKAARIAYLKQLVVRDPSQQVFLADWLARCNSFLDLQKKTLSHSSPLA